MHAQQTASSDSTFKIRFYSIECNIEFIKGFFFPPSLLVMLKAILLVTICSDVKTHTELVQPIQCIVSAVTYMYFSLFLIF